MVGSCPIYGEIVQKDMHEGWYIFAENFRDGPLEGCWCCLELEHHDYGNIDPLAGDKRYFFMVVGVHAYLVVSTESI